MYVAKYIVVCFFSFLKPEAETGKQKSNNYGFLRVTLSLISPSSLKKMTVGMFLASMAFVAAAIVQVEIDVSCLLTLQWPFLVDLGTRPPPGLRL